MNEKMERKQTYSIDEILIHVVGNVNVRDKRKFYMDLDGDRVKVRSDRLLCFKRKGTKCVKCGLEGKFFAKEKFLGDKSNNWHLNLYAVDEQGHEVLMTKDHIMPKSKGGSDALYNYQPMCTRCNSEKADTVPKMPRLKKKTSTEFEADIARLNSIMGGKDATISKLTIENKALTAEMQTKRKEFQRLQRDNIIFKKRIEQLIRLLTEPIPDIDSIS